jgi:hypothetical protein
MPCLALYGSCLRGYAAYAQGLRFGLTEWIIQRMIRNRKLANPFILFETVNTFFISYIHAYNEGRSRLRSYLMTMVIHHDSGRTSWLRSYISWLWSHFMTLVMPHDSGRTRLWSYRMSYFLTCWTTLLDQAIWLQHLIVRSLSLK